MMLMLTLEEDDDDQDEDDGLWNRMIAIMGMIILHKYLLYRYIFCSDL